MDLNDLLKGKKVRYITDAKVPVILEITNIEERSHSKDLEEATRENDWWPQSVDWITYEVEFTTGFKKSFFSLSEIELIKEN